MEVNAKKIERASEKEEGGEGQTDRQTGRQIDRQTDRNKEN